MARSTSISASVRGLPPSRAIWHPEMLAFALHQSCELAQNIDLLVRLEPPAAVGEHPPRTLDLAFEGCGVVAADLRNRRPVECLNDLDHDCPPSDFRRRPRRAESQSGMAECGDMSPRLTGFNGKRWYKTIEKGYHAAISSAATRRSARRVARRGQRSAPTVRCRCRAMGGYQPHLAGWRKLAAIQRIELGMGGANRALRCSRREPGW